MAGACSSSPGFMVVEGTLIVHLPGDEPPAPEPEWVTVECSSKKAYGCGELGEKLFQGLTLYVSRLGRADLNSSLSIDLSDEAVRSIQEELGVPLRLLGEKGPLLDVQGFVRVADHGVLVLFVNFSSWYHGKRAYYIVYDATDASLYMIPYIPSRVEAIYTVTPVPARPHGGRGHELALVAQKLWPQPGRAERGRLCVCTPATREANPSAPGDGPWEIKVHRNFPAPPQAFCVDLMFSSADKVFWADLSRGIAYSDLRQGGPVVDTEFVPLPDGYVIDFHSLPEKVQVYPVKMSRTMSCVEGSIKFVCIDRDVTTRRPGNETVIKVWTLDLDGRLWKEEDGLACPWGELWMKACAINAGLRDLLWPLEPQYPVLLPGGALCLVLPKTRHRNYGPRVKKPDYICSFNMLSKSCLCFGQVRSYHVIDPVVLPYNFFKNCCPAYKRKPTHKRKLPSIDVPMPARSLAVTQ